MSETELLSRLIGDIYDAALDPARWPGVLEGSCRFVGSAGLYLQDAVNDAADLSERLEIMRFVHGDASEASLPEMAGALAQCMDDAGIAAVDRRQRAAQPVGIGRHANEWTWLGIKHQAQISTPAAWQASRSR